MEMKDKKKLKNIAELHDLYLFIPETAPEFARRWGEADWFLRKAGQTGKMYKKSTRNRANAETRAQPRLGEIFFH